MRVRRDIQSRLGHNRPPSPTRSAWVGTNRVAHVLQGHTIPRSKTRILVRRGPALMATDYDTPRKTDDELSEDSLEELKARRADLASSTVDVDETELAESHELPGADLSGEELTVRVVPKQEDEFTCSRCFLVHHRSQLASKKNGQPVCKDCA